MADRKISDLTALTTPASGDFLPIVDISEAAAASKNKKITYSDFLNNIPTGTITSTMILDGTILNADINASAAIVDTKLATIATGGKVSGTAITSGNISTSGSFTSTSTVTGTNLIPTGSGVPTNGIYLPAANSVAVATNGAGRLFVDASGKVGISTGATALTSQLQIQAGTGQITQIFLNNVGDTTGDESRLDFKLSASPSVLATGRISGIRTGAGALTDLAFSTFNASSLLERLRITAAGLVGIGNSTPGAMLDIIPVGLNTPFRITSNDSGVIYKSSSAANKRFQLFFQDNSGTQTAKIGADISGANASNLQFVAGSGATPQMTLTSTGLAIGTASPSAPLCVQGAANSDQLIVTGLNGLSRGLKISTGADYANDSLVKYDAQYASGSNYGAHAFLTGGQERLRLDRLGRLLVGTSSSIGFIGSTAATLQAVNTGTQYALGMERATNDISGPVCVFRKTRSTSNGGNTIVSSADDLGYIRFAGTDGSAAVLAAEIKAQVDGTPGANDMPGRLVFSTTADGAASPTERMRITNSGATYSLIDNSEGRALGTLSAASASNYFIQGVHGKSSIQAGGTRSFGVFTNGNVVNTNNSYGAISDLKLKENIVDAGSQWDDLKALQVRNYNFKEGQTHTQIGLVAQEVELVSPGLVGESPDRDEDGNDLGTVTKSVNYSVLYMKAVKALQEAMERIETLEARLTAAGIE
jgi:hypothetical protein